MLKHLPNILTLLNLGCGFFSLLMTMEGHMMHAGYFIFLAAVFDFSDGLAARVFNAFSDLGKQLDSLADVVSFGVAPAILFSALIIQTLDQPVFQSGGLGTIFHGLIVFSPVLIVMATALRLGRFNIETHNDSMFSGLPSPASGILLGSLVFIHDEMTRIPPWIFLMVSLLLSFLLISRIPVLSLKVKKIRDGKTWVLFFSLIFSVLIILVFSIKYIVALIILYIFIAAVVPQIIKR